MQPTQSVEFWNFKIYLTHHLQSVAFNWCIQFFEATDISRYLGKIGTWKCVTPVDRPSYSGVKGGKFLEHLLSLKIINDASVGNLITKENFIGTLLWMPKYVIYF